jgi:hypothetical protein
MAAPGFLSLDALFSTIRFNITMYIGEQLINPPAERLRLSAQLGGSGWSSTSAAPTWSSRAALGCWQAVPLSELDPNRERFMAFALGYTRGMLQAAGYKPRTTTLAD